MHRRPMSHVPMLFDFNILPCRPSIAEKSTSQTNAHGAKKLFRVILVLRKEWQLSDSCGAQHPSETRNIVGVPPTHLPLPLLSPSPPLAHTQLTSPPQAVSSWCSCAVFEHGSVAYRPSHFLGITQGLRLLLFLFSLVACR